MKFTVTSGVGVTEVVDRVGRETGVELHHDGVHGGGLGQVVEDSLWELDGGGPSR